MYIAARYRLIDRLYPGKVNWQDKTFQVPKIEAMKIMRERERIAIFSKLVQEYGVPDTYTFPTESLHEQGALNLAQVCVCIRALGIEVRIACVELSSLPVALRYMVIYTIVGADSAGFEVLVWLAKHFLKMGCLNVTSIKSSHKTTRRIKLNN